MTITNIEELFIDELKDVYSSEKQLVQALPKLAKASSSKDLKKAFEGHLSETKGHIKRIEQIFKLLGETPKSKTCEATRGLVEEGKDAIDTEFEGENLQDNLLIGCGQKVEHYEIASYGTLKAWAEKMNKPKVVKLLDETLEEEKAADKKLSDIADALAMVGNGK